MPKGPEWMGAAEFEVAPERRGKDVYVLRLYVAGMAPRSVRAVSNLRHILEKYLKGRYELEVVDVYQNPVLGRDVQVVGAPTLVKQWPLPPRRFLGDLSDTARILKGLGIAPQES